MRCTSLIFCTAFCCLLRCGAAGGKKVAVKEVVVDSAIVDMKWLGADHTIVLLQTSKGRLYRSTNGGDTWNDITEQLKLDSTSGVPITVDQMTLSPADPNTIMVAGTRRTHFISLNAGETWRRVRQKATIHTFMFHKTRPKWALLSSWSDACEATKVRKEPGETLYEEDGPCTHMLHITKDLGRTFSLVTNYVVQFSWGTTEMGQQDRIYFTHFRQKTGDQPRLTLWSKLVDFAYSDDSGNKVNRLVYRGNKFLVSHSFIFAAKLKDAASQTVSLMCSSDGGTTFRVSKLPQELEERSYTILDTSEGSVILHVNHGSKDGAGVGNVYISDKDGTKFTLSLANNVRSNSGDCEFDRILSLEGVYMANFKDIPKTDNADGDKGKKTQSDETTKEAEELESSSTATEVDKRRSARSRGKDESVIRTVISFDKGGAWSYLKPPKVDSVGKKIDCPPDKCWLHLHGITNFHNYAPFYSIENAIGIIMGTGNVGAYLRFEPDQINTYLSRDGGLSWVEAHKGAFIYEFGDHGGLVVMADDIKKTKQVVFSWNEGQSWYDFELSDFPVEVDNIVTEPNATSTKFLLYGTRGDSGVVYHLDFDALGQPLCKGVWAADSVSSDYETWTPSDGDKSTSDKCMLGRTVTYTRRKQTSECFNGEKFERPVVKKNCACTETNFNCEMGFARKVGSMECKLTEDYAGLMTIPESCTTSDYFFGVAHRKVVGDTCEGGWQPQKSAIPCPAGSKMSRGAMSVLSTIAMVAIAMGLANYLAQSERFKGMFSNVGFDSFGNVGYAAIGAKAPETGMDSVGVRFDADFIEDDFADDAPQLMSYTGGGGDRGGSRDRDRDRDRNEAPRRIETAAASVPKLAGPPGGAAAAGDDDSVDLL